MPDDTTITDESTLIVPEETAKQYPDLVNLIKASHSMDNEERQYWVDVLPIMSEDQIGNLESILDNEKQQINQADDAYAKGMGEVTKNVKVTFDETIYREKKNARVEAERMHEEEESLHEESILKELEGL